MMRQFAASGSMMGIGLPAGSTKVALLLSGIEEVRKRYVAPNAPSCAGSVGDTKAEA